MRQHVSIILAAAIVSLGFSAKAEAQFGSLFKSKVAVPEVTAAQVRALQTRHDDDAELAKQNGGETPEPSFILVDARSEAEYAVSVIPGAITTTQYERDRELYKDRTVICYCTSGYRSDKYARKLIEDGIPAKNFKGSILGWCAAEYPLETLEREPTNRVHTYSSRNKVPAKYKPVW